MGDYGANNNTGVFCKSAIGKLFFNKEINLSKTEYIKNFQTTVENAEIVVKATICLHNFLCQTNSAGFCLTDFVDS